MCIMHFWMTLQLLCTPNQLDSCVAKPSQTLQCCSLNSGWWLNRQGGSHLTEWPYNCGYKLPAAGFHCNLLPKESPAPGNYSVVQTNSNGHDSKQGPRADVSFQVHLRVHFLCAQHQYQTHPPPGASDFILR